MLKVLIPTSGLGSRLGEITEYTNKALVSVGTKAVISHIIESYPEGTEFYIMLGHKGNLVREYLELAHPDTSFVWLDAEMLHGNLGLVRALGMQIHTIGGPFIFHASDTICGIPESFVNYEGNAILAYPCGSDNSQYRTIRPTTGNQLKIIQEKGELVRPGDLVHIGVVKVHEFDSFRITLNAETDAWASDTAVVNAMLPKGRKFQLFETPFWFDTGNSSKLTQAREHFSDPEFVLLEKADQAVYIVGDRVIKFFSKPEMVAKRIERGRYLGEAIPKLLGYNEHFFAYRKAEGTLARDTMYPAQFLRFLDTCEQTIWSTPPPDISGFSANAHAFYWDKTIARLNAFYEKTGLTDRGDIINGEGVPPLHEMLEQFSWSTVVRGCPATGFHGDLHFSNVIVEGESSFTLLDWREGFGDSTEYGDVYYDLGKILHGLIVSHDLVERNLFSVDVVESELARLVTIDIHRHQRHVECEEFFLKWLVLHEYDTETVRLMAALIFLNIAALHHHPYDQFLYFLGKRMIFDLLS
jgi:NDP-sugar pyrophosphorylase family protein/thiamine kinase-like enzyme